MSATLAEPQAGALAAPLISARGLVKRFGGITAVDGVDLDVARGEVLGFLGPNGAGKSTTMKMITGFLDPDEGAAIIAGIPVAERPVAAARMLGYLPEGAPAYDDMSPRGFLKFCARTRGGVSRAMMERAIERASLAPVLDQPIETLSKGFKRRVGLAQAILHEPPALIMDEPTDGLDPNQKHEVRRLIAELAADKAILISTHILEEVEAVCDRAVIIDGGRIVADGAPAALAARAAGHNAVRLVIAEADVFDARRELATHDQVADIEEWTPGEGAAGLRVTAHDGGPLIGVVADLAHAHGWRVLELAAERGRLDAVFHALTQGENARSRAA